MIQDLNPGRGNIFVSSLKHPDLPSGTGIFSPRHLLGVERKNLPFKKNLTKFLRRICGV